MIDVILHGCSGRMGNVLTALIAPLADMRIVAGVDIHPREAVYPVFPSLELCTVRADVLLDFTSRESLRAYLPECVKRGLPAVVATTGLDRTDLEYLGECSFRIPVFRSANMSQGINLIQQLLQSTVKVLGEHFDVEIVEKHHNLKKDAPSGTALMLADSINEADERRFQYVYGRRGADCLRQPREMGIHSVRGGTLVGEHEVLFLGKDEQITIGHKAFSRQVFATGAVAAARFIVRRKPGMYSMQDLINEYNAVTTLSTVVNEDLVTLGNFPNDTGMIAELYGAFAEADIFIDMISHSGAADGRVSISFTTKSEDLNRVHGILDRVKQRTPGVGSTVDDHICKISVEGSGMEFQSGIAYRVFSAMAANGITIMAVTTSEIKISCVTSRADREKAVSIIRREFGI